jgi:uncharacterized SAM-binding protein YcdF (DUF218 family)
MNGLVHFFFSATGALVWLFTAVLWIARRPRSIAARRTLLTVAAMYALASIYAVPALAARALSAGYAPFTAADAPRGRTAIVVLGSGSVLIEGWDANLRLDLMTSIEAARVLEAWRVYCLISPDLVISSGGRPDPDDPSQPSGANMHDALVRLGVPDARILVETASQNTHDEAVIVAPMLRAHGVEHMVLVTSATHMRRSLAVFRAQGWDAIPAIAADPGRFTTTWRTLLLPSDRGLEMSEQVVHELLGLPYYWLRGWETFA